MLQLKAPSKIYLLVVSTSGRDILAMFFVSFLVVGLVSYVISTTI